ncbi:uncharacterized protein L3040_003730 [Drepanopeziza brunnea f. sp. 'multigermtubi']|uniref:Kinetochore protein mis14 n=1 Tax=Marssonina brunnea f. sp. multigermtubi (strain MB_m1) TaxID=1072389 RepID=K1XR34_MARBU|nr:uncharacterized protein MBM_06830 [Drepanopeziza brunnea f. sp. 'multigermtubi' MB_m1]EKD15069.1 hypothetical protein MBM_06830 [Drepanopeziza brunnea f. sp. 'multigermtubi' MB_m1]KAJ5046487.1 hypothetical protein L3040_003730 [Drepanopeziza brunnea f. sp. 'multigermtubi']
MAEFQRKIELQSPDDLQFLISNIRRAANEKIDKDLPPIAGEDELRERVEELVHAYINNVFQTASENITINGLDPSEDLLKSMLSNTSTNPTLEIEEHEPFNAKLFERAKDLARQEEDLIEEIASLRRKVPAQVAQTINKEYKEGIEADEGVLNALEEGVQAEEKQADLGVGKLERQEGVERGWGKGVKGLEGLMRTLPETLARKEKAERAEVYIGKGDKR